MSNPIIINTDNYTFDLGYNIFLIDCTSSDINLYMPEIIDGSYFTIKRIDTTTNNCDLHVNPIDNAVIDDSTADIVLGNYDFIDILSYGGKWWILNRI
jgi:hypothetical protein